ncbi:MAG: LPS export ABC transporter ATP-binding protein [Magnetococcales bacterium]|nr:LPS export ABC transporter ATP-binding protein [Magnetococcales bacterium]MBF0262692.1 LPS export ABC transporter ATP-binding protein [Magnetococcales bacterium]
MNASVKPCLEAKDLGKSYQGRAVVNAVSLAVEPGEVVGLLGPNGAGKSTMFYMFVGLVVPDSGSIWLDGAPITNEPIHLRARAGIAYLPQEPSIFRKMTVADNILAILETRPLNRRERLERLDRLMRELGVDHLAATKGYALSGGERRRVEVARALAIEPRYILLDEPFAGVDPLAVADIQAIIRHLAGLGIGILITDHNVRETLGICDHAYILSQGMVLARGRPDEVVRDHQVRTMYLGMDFQL